MSSATATVELDDTRIPGEEELAHDLRTMSPAMHIYSAGRDWFFAEHGGRIYPFPPDLGGELVPHPFLRENGPRGEVNAGAAVMVKADGKLDVRDTWGHVKDQFGRSLGEQQLKGQEAAAIVRFMAVTYHERGVCWLRADGKDEGRVKAAKLRYARFIRRWAEQEVATRQQFVAGFKRMPGNENRLPPPPTEQQNRAAIIMDELMDEAREDVAFICDQGCIQTNDWKVYERHMRVRHGRKVKPPTDLDQEAAAAGRQTAAPVGLQEKPETAPAKSTGKGAGGKTSK